MNRVWYFTYGDNKSYDYEILRDYGFNCNNGRTYLITSKYSLISSIPDGYEIIQEIKVPVEYTWDGSVPLENFEIENGKELEEYFNSEKEAIEYIIKYINKIEINIKQEEIKFNPINLFK